MRARGTGSYIITISLSFFFWCRLAGISYVERRRRYEVISWDRCHDRFWATDQEARDHFYAERLKIESAAKFETVRFPDTVVDVGVVER